ncbi:diguanylate cyclase [Achromobacter aloeverae]|uniref:Diguanylate cyclase n=1 Tax=Achromobacter aloeverae TaxID=1750518 RepID=A0A4Q1HCE2_9BURK|nr:diguanylate cyclase [Achromobacter aloeverae]RXN83325.1 diguanylate cyclase [Achromobacter aloeverae]
MSDSATLANDPVLALLLYLVLPLWLLAGFADWLCHRRSDIAHTAGMRESLLHLLMFSEIAVPLLACLFLEINASVFLLIVVCFFLHEATALWDVSYAGRRRRITTFEQHVHSFLEILPLAATLLLAVRHWGQFLAMWGLGQETAEWRLRMKADPLPAAEVIGILAAAVVMEIIPYLEELWRGWQAGRGARRRGAAPG